MLKTEEYKVIAVDLRTNDDSQMDEDRGLTQIGH